MLAIRMQRTGRKDSAQFRVVVQDSRRTPTSGNIVALVGNYNPHTKETNIDKEKLEFYLNNGAQPSDRVVRIMKKQKMAIPSWVKQPVDKQSKTKNSEKLRKHQPVEEKPAVVEEAPASEPVEAVAETEAPDTKEEAKESETIQEEAPAEVEADTEEKSA